MLRGKLGDGVTAKDIILAIIAKIGIGGGTGHVFEYRGEAIRSLSMEGRMTVCNMSIEGGARAGMVAPDDTTFEYISGRQHAPSGADWEAAAGERWRELPTDDGAVFDQEITIRADELIPMITYGTNPGMGMPITAPCADARRRVRLQQERSRWTRRCLYGPCAGAEAAGQSDRRRLHRQLHQFADLGSAPGG